MAGKNKREAIHNFAGYIRESLSCISDAYLLVFQESTNLYKIFYEQPADLLTQDGDYRLSFVQICTAGEDRKYGGYKAKTRNYSYTLLSANNGHDEEVFSYHWHPHDSEVRTPHLHVACIPRIHFPTSRVSIEDIIRMLISYYGVEPIVADSECSRILDKNGGAFHDMATWK